MMNKLLIPKICWLLIILLKFSGYYSQSCQSYTIPYGDITDTVRASWFTYETVTVGATVPSTGFTVVKIAVADYRGKPNMVFVADKGTTRMVVFRGTKHPTQLVEYARDYIEYATQPDRRTEVTFNDQDATVLKYFADVVDLLLPQINSLLNDASKKYLITGHSLGGALASLLSIKLKDQSSAVWTNHGSAMITYGAPRVGDSRYAQVHDQMIPSYKKLRFTTKGDVIAILPFKPLFIHHSREVYGEEINYITWKWWEGIKTRYEVRICKDGDLSNSGIGKSFKQHYSFARWTVLAFTGFTKHMSYRDRLTSGDREFEDKNGNTRSSWESAFAESC